MKSTHLLGMTTALALVLAPAIPSAARADAASRADRDQSPRQPKAPWRASSSPRTRTARSSRPASSPTHRAITRFPESRLEPGHYTLAIRAVGYDLASPAATDVVGEKTTNVDLKLDKTKNLPDQLTNAEWVMSMPGHRRAEGGAAQLHELPHPGTRREVDARRRRVDARHHPHDGLRRGQPADQAAADARPLARRHAGAIPQDGRVSRHHQSQRDRSLDLRSEDPAASDRPQHPRHHHRIRCGAQDNRAARHPGR